MTKILKFQEARQMLQSKKKVAYKKVSLHMWGEKKPVREREGGRERMG